MQRLFFSTLNPLSPVIFATAGVVAFLLLCNPTSRFNFHCYTQREATPTQKLALRPLLALVTSCAKDYKGHSLVQTSFTEPPNSAKSCPEAYSDTQAPAHTNLYININNHIIKLIHYAQTTGTTNLDNN